MVALGFEPRQLRLCVPDQFITMPLCPVNLLHKVTFVAVDWQLQKEVARPLVLISTLIDFPTDCVPSN